MKFAAGNLFLLCATNYLSFIGKYYEKKTFLLKHKAQVDTGFTTEVAIYFSYRIDNLFSIIFFNF